MGKWLSLNLYSIRNGVHSAHVNGVFDVYNIRHCYYRQEDCKRGFVCRLSASYTHAVFCFKCFAQVDLSFCQFNIAVVRNLNLNPGIFKLFLCSDE